MPGKTSRRPLGKRAAAFHQAAVHSLPIFMRLQGRPVILLGKGEAADAKRRLLERAGARAVDEADAGARLAIVALAEEAEAAAAVARLQARGVLVNAVDRPALCDWTLPAIVDRSPVLVAIGTGGASAGLAAALRQRLETLLPAALGRLAAELRDARAKLRVRFPAGDDRRRAIDAALAPGGPLDLIAEQPPGAVDGWLTHVDAPRGTVEAAVIALRSADPDELTLREARLLARADRVVHDAGVPAAILARARADAERVTDGTANDGEGLTVVLRMERA